MEISPGARPFLSARERNKKNGVYKYFEKPTLLFFYQLFQLQTNTIKMYARIARIATTIPTKKMAYSLAGASVAYAYLQQCKNDVIFFTKSK